MKFKKTDLKPDEWATLQLRSLYEEYGYKKFRMGRFEEYSLYVANKDFLGSDKVITFTDLDGRLLALKPDVTLSIIKNTRATRKESEKLYYIENVYRESKENHTYVEINQMGLEYLGDLDLYGISEVISLAVNSLKAIDGDYLLEMSHMTFVVELLQSLPTSQETNYKLLRLIRNKNADGIERTAEAAGLSPQQTASLCRIPSLYGDVPKVVREASKLAVNDAMRNALSEISAVFSVLKALGCGKNVQLDLSMVNDIDYYNGVIFKGYINGLSRHVLAGGQYDRAMAMFGKDVGAMGFALYLNEINRLEREPEQYDVDILLLYDESADVVGVAQEVQRLQKANYSVRAEKEIPAKLRYKNLYRYKDNQVPDQSIAKEETTC